MSGAVRSINVSTEKGKPKAPVSHAVLVAGMGVEGDAHAGGVRQVSLLAQESIDKAAAAGVALNPGDFGENVTTQGIDVVHCRLGDRLLLGEDAIVQILEIGKTCSEPCSIGRRLGECVMPVEGVFAKVMRGGTVAPGDAIRPADVKVGAVLTSSDRCSSGEREDESGRVLVEFLQEMGAALAEYVILPDDQSALSEKLKFLADKCAVDLVLTTGGTGLAPRDHMPEATLAVLDSRAPGISEAIRAEGMRHTPHASLSRAVSGLRGRTLIINLPGSRRAVEQSLGLLRKIVPHALELLRAEVADCGRGEV